MSDRFSYLFSTMFKRLFKTRRRSILNEAVQQFIEVSQDEGYRLSDMFRAFADYSNSQKQKEPEELVATWDAVATLLEATATEAETPGRELP